MDVIPGLTNHVSQILHIALFVDHEWTQPIHDKQPDAPLSSHMAARLQKKSRPSGCLRIIGAKNEGGPDHEQTIRPSSPSPIEMPSDFRGQQCHATLSPYEPTEGRRPNTFKPSSYASEAGDILVLCLCTNQRLESGGDQYEIQEKG